MQIQFPLATGGSGPVELDYYRDLDPQERLLLWEHASATSGMYPTAVGAALTLPTATPEEAKLALRRLAKERSAELVELKFIDAVPVAYRDA